MNDAAASGSGSCFALHDAVSARDLKTVQALLDQGADCNLIDDDGWTPLMWADEEPMVRVLLEAGADAGYATDAGESVLMAVARRGNAEAVTALVQGGALDPNAGDAVGDTALMEAAWVGNLGTVEVLLKLGADVNQRTRGGGTALDAAREEGHMRVVELLLAHGALGSAATPTSVHEETADPQATQER